MRGRLDDRVPLSGERVDVLVDAPVVRVEHIVSGVTESPVGFDQDRDEWVVVVAGGATLEIDGDDIELATGDWVLLPARTPHRLLRTDPGTQWIAVHYDGSLRNEDLEG